MSSPVLSAQDLECIRGQQQLFCSLSFKLGPGDLLHVKGANGCGKTSLLRILCGLSYPTAGQVLWRGQSIWQERHKFCAELAYLGHHLGIKGELTPQENLIFASRLSARRSNLDLDEILSRAGLSDCAQTPARYLSAGQRQRIALARLLLQQAKLWVLDEPFISLDSEGQNWVHNLLEEHLQQGGLVVLTSHQPIHVQANVLTLQL